MAFKRPAVRTRLSPPKRTGPIRVPFFLAETSGSRTVLRYNAKRFASSRKNAPRFCVNLAVETKFSVKKHPPSSRVDVPRIEDRSDHRFLTSSPLAAFWNISQYPSSSPFSTVRKSQSSSASFGGRIPSTPGTPYPRYFTSASSVRMPTT